MTNSIRELHDLLDGGRLLGAGEVERTSTCRQPFAATGAVHCEGRRSVDCCQVGCRGGASCCRARRSRRRTGACGGRGDGHLVYAEPGVEPSQLWLLDGNYVAVRHEDVDLGLRHWIIEAGEERDALHVLRFLERVRNKIGTNDAEAKVDALAHEPSHLGVDRDRARHNGEVAGRRELDDSAVDEEALAARTDHRAQRAIDALAQAREIYGATLQAEDDVVGFQTIGK